MQKVKSHATHSTPKIMTKKLIDTATIKIKAGDGGDGRVSFRRERFVPKGGPDGGNGGNGGSVYLEATHNMATLMDFRAKPNYSAQAGEMGGKQNKTGADGKDLTIKLPVGTQVFLKTENENILVGDLINNGQKLKIAQGGRGGKGNVQFKNSTNRTPLEYTEGTKGEAKTLVLEIKLIADVGLVGLPNAGKSTLINHLTNANAKTAQYPFTTLSPNLGVCSLPDDSTIVLADIPGLIEGASEGKGLGDDFLRHIERTRLLVHILDPLGHILEGKFDAVLQSYWSIREELTRHTSSQKDFEKLSEKQEVVVINKLDITEVKQAFPEIKALFAKEGVEILGISAVTGEGVEVLKSAIMAKLAGIPRPKFELGKVTKIYTIENLPNRRIVFDNTVKRAKETILGR
jgi:GTP-binding protein